MLKNKSLAVIALALLSLCAMMFAGCTLEDDIEMLRKQVKDSSGNGDNGAGNSSDGDNSGSGSGPIDLTIGTWQNASLSPGTVHQYRFYASVGNYHYAIFWEDVDYGSSYSADIKVGVKKEGSSSYIIEPTNFGNDPNSRENCIVLYVSTSGYYIIEVQGYNSSSSGSYAIGYWMEVSINS